MCLYKFVGKLEDLYGLLVPLRGHFKEVVDWELGGSVYYDYITLTRDVKNCVTMATNSSTMVPFSHFSH
jgi:hypothetical protein